MWGTGADPQATLTAGNKRLFVEGKSTLKDKDSSIVIIYTHAPLVVDDREQALPAAQKPCFVKGKFTSIKIGAV